MVNGHCADAMVCISNCDKITPGMLMASLRLNIPTVFVSGGPMEAGKVVLAGKAQALDLVDAMVAAADDRVSDADVKIIERSACPTCGSCSGMFTANSMNCLTEALGLSLPGNGSTLATHADRKRLFVEAGHLIVDLAQRHYEQDDDSVLPRSIASKGAFENAMTLDIAMGGSTNTVLHILAAAHEGEIDFDMDDIDLLSRRVPVLCKVAPAKADVHMEDVHRAGGIMAILGQLDKAGLINRDLPTVHTRNARRGARPLGHFAQQQPVGARFLHGGARRRADAGRLQPGPALAGTRSRPRGRRDPRCRASVFQGWRAGGAEGQSGARRLHREDGRRRREHPEIHRPGKGVRKPGCRRSTPSSATGSRRATSSSSATRDRAAGPACRKCSIRPAI